VGSQGAATADRGSAVGALVDRVARWWQGVRWPLLVVLAVAAFVLGYVGFRQYFDDEGITKSSTDVAYLTLQLFTLESGSVPETGAPWQLEIARLLAPGVAAAAVVAALAVAFREQIADWRLRREHDHVVVCGLGSTGARLAGELLDHGHRVVGIEIDESTPAVAALRRRGAGAIVGDARDLDVLGRARLERASHVICLTGNDDSNAEVALQAGILTADRHGPALACLAHIRDPDLCQLMRSEELAATQHGGARLDFFNIEDQGARVILSDYPPFPLDPDDALEPHILVVGLNRLGLSLVAELAHQWRNHPRAYGRRLAITVIDPDAPEQTDRLRRRYPQLDHAAEIQVITAAFDPLDPEGVAGVAWTMAYVCIDADSVALQAALTVRHQLEQPDALVVVEIVQADGMARLIDRPEHADHIRAFNLLGRTLKPELLLGGTHEVLARAIHQTYLDEQRASGATAATNPSMVPWEQLSDSLKESNRDQAAHIGTKLAAIGCGIAPLTDWDADKITFTNAEVELLAEMEHDRWVNQRRADGWTPGPKDIAAKKTPYLVPWNELSDEVKEWDRQAVRGIPAFLARAGYEVVAPTSVARPEDERTT
jgi:hypothetical protein